MWNMQYFSFVEIDNFLDNIFPNFYLIKKLLES